MTQSGVASLTVEQAVCVNKSHAFLQNSADQLHQTVPHDAAAYVNLPLGTNFPLIVIRNLRALST